MPDYTRECLTEDGFIRAHHFIGFSLGYAGCTVHCRVQSECHGGEDVMRLSCLCHGSWEAETETRRGMEGSLL